MYLPQGIPETAEVAIPVAHFPSNQASGPGTDTAAAAATDAAPVSGIPNTLPLDLFPQVAFCSFLFQQLVSLFLCKLY